MLALGICLIVLSALGLVAGLVRLASGHYNPMFASTEECEAVCNAHAPPVGSPPGTECGHPVKGDDGKVVACRRGVVNRLGNACEVEEDHLGPGLCAGSVVAFLVGVVVLLIPAKSGKKNKK